MKRALFSQIKNDWRENIWLVIELTIVALTVWGLSLSLLRSFKDSSIPLGADINDVYVASFQYIDKYGSLLFFHDDMQRDSIRNKVAKHVQGMLDRIRNLPMVEAVAVGRNCHPYTYNYSGNIISYKSKEDTVNLEANTRLMTPDGVMVLRLQSKDGHTLEQLKRILENGHLLFGAAPEIEMYADDWNFDVNKLVGTELIGNWSNNKIEGIIQNLRRHDYEVGFGASTIILPIQENTLELLETGNLMIRIKHGKDKEFKEAMQSEPALIAPTTVALSKLRPLSDDKRVILWKNETTQRTKVAGIIFLLIIVFIGLLGTFWYRVYLRTPEIAVRKIFGANDSDIFRRLISEALFLLLIALILTLALYFGCLDYLKSGLLKYIVYFKTWKWDVALSGIITAGTMILMILIGVGIPARRAMRIEPANALKEE